MKCVMAGVISLLLACYAVASYADNVDFLTATAPNVFTQEDWTYFGEATQKALNAPQNGAKVDWSNPATGHGGFIQPIDTVNKNGQTCRNVKVGNIDQGRLEQYDYLFCKAGKEWTLMPTGG